MTNVQFDSEREESRFRLRPLEPPRGLYEFVIKLGLAKDNKEANIVLLIITGLAALIGILYPFMFG